MPVIMKVSTPRDLWSVRARHPIMWHNTFNRLQRCYERLEPVVDAFFDLADAIITLRSLIRQAWTRYRWDTRPPHPPPIIDYDPLPR